ncbi:FGGY family carbohydrate kinase [Elusimicrobiota bacterium]
MTTSSKTCILGLDQGSSSTKAVLLACKNGKIIAKTSVPIKTRRYISNGLQFVEHDAQDIWESAKTAIRRVLIKKPKNMQVSSLGISSQRSSCVLIDRESLAPLTPVISWQDLRGTNIVKNISQHSELIYERSGLYLTPYYTLSKLIWCLKNIKKAQEKSRKGEACMAFVTTYLAAKLTGGKTLAADPTLAQRSLLYNIEINAWDEDLVRKLGIPKGILPDIVPTNGFYGYTDSKEIGLSIPITAMVGDQQSAFLASSTMKDTQSGLINLGTGGFVLIGTGNRLLRFPGLLTGILAGHSKTNQYMLEGTVTSIQGILRWLADLGIAKSTRELGISKLDPNEQIPIIAGGFGGIAAPFWRSDIKVNIFDLDHSTGKQALLTGFLYGIAHLFWEILKPLKNSELFPKQLIASGGLSNNRDFLQVLSDYMNLPIYPALEHDLTALGACYASDAKTKLDLNLGKPIRPDIKKAHIVKNYQKRASEKLRSLLALK